jgi:hypothetical protein
MKRLIILITLISFLFSLQVGYSAPLTTTLKDQKDMAVTIYNSNVGLVKDTRIIEFKPGIHELKFMDVAAKIDPTTVHIKSLINGSSLNVLEQNYEYDLLSPQKLLEKFVGQKVQLATFNQETKKEEIVEATLLSTQGGNIFRSEIRSTSAIMEEFCFQESLKTSSPNPHWFGCWKISFQDPKS